MPTRDQLLTILDLNAGPPLIDPIFGATQASRYWSSTEFLTGAAFTVFFFDNGIADVGVDLKFNEFHVRAVRAGP